MELLIGIAIGVVGMVIIQHGWGWVLALYHKYVNPQ
jgi:hypothetical protein